MFTQHDELAFVHALRPILTRMNYPGARARFAVPLPGRRGAVQTAFTATVAASSLSNDPFGP